MSAALAELLVAWSPLRHAPAAFLDSFDLPADVDPLADLLFGRPFDLDGGEPSYGSAEMILGAAPVLPVDPDLFEIDDSGTWAVLQAVAPDGDTIVDLLSWHPAAPDRWRFLRGDGDALGEREIALRQDRDGPIRAYATPLSWHRAGGRGVCVLRRQWPTVQRLFVVGERQLVADSVELGDWLDAMLRFRTAPAILVEDD